ncbi:EAL domain-containing protein [Bacillus sp. EB600]|uniref:EAL domain-containing protein n=1 Tax=Bacillus sp. EB600 TaxID=2806345 RepID=UPI00210C254C|nr:EAL domain-containing protein [Bacillus sp. EB600]MCQ6280716.1 EAL domain-containing protein [Bacillus sp. EB600]
MEHSGESERSNLTLPNDIGGKSTDQLLTEKLTESLFHRQWIGHSEEESSLISSNYTIDPLIFDFDKINKAINSEAILLITDSNGVILYLNDNCCKNVGYQPDELIGKHTKIFKTGIHSNEFYHELWASLLAGEIWKGEMTAKRKDGSTVWNFITIFPILNKDKQPYQFLTLRTDITKQKIMENQVARRDKQIQAIIQNTNDTIGSMDQNGNLSFLNSGFEKQLGYHPQEIIGKSIFDFIADEHLMKTKNTLKALITSPGLSVRMEIKVKNKKGNSIWVEFHATNYLKDPLLNGITFTFRDITKQKKISEEMKRMAYYDFLTGVPNRRFFENLLRKEIIRAKGNNTSLALLLIDIDEFKYVNNSFGHSIGDQLLESMSSRLKRSFANEGILCRPGGDEFVLLLPEINNLEEVSIQANNLISLINEEPFNVQGNNFFITASVGISVYPFSGETMEALLKHADMAMYRAKHNGKNQFQLFSSTMDLHIFKQFTLRNDSKQALLNDEYSIYFQPRFDPKNNDITGAEALIRWNHPRWGLVSPDEFISMAEESGLIVPIGAWMFQKVCQQLKKWQMEGVAIKKVSINLSALELLQSNFIEMVSSVLKKENLDSKWIEFEITERVIIDKEEQALKVLSQIKKLGISLALDDFGTGYSAINYLWKFPCDTIKIDRSLIKEMQKKNASYEIVAAVIALCKKLKKSVVAEGVETAEQIEVLKKLACEEIQGYLFSRPIEEHKFVQLLKQGKWVPESKINHPYLNKREYFRVHLEYPLEADMTIERIGTKTLNIGSTKVLIDNIGPGGLCFLSTIKLPKKEDIILRFTTEIFLGNFQINGHIVWSGEVDDDILQYGIKFNIDEIRREGLIKILQHLQVKLKDKSLLSNSRFISEDKTSYIKRQIVKGNYTHTHK